MQNINSQWITPYVKSLAFDTCMILEEGDPTWHGFYLNVWFYILCRDLGSIPGKAEWSVVSDVTLPGPRAESIMRVSWTEAQEEEDSESNMAGFTGQIIHMLDQLWNDDENNRIGQDALEICYGYSYIYHNEMIRRCTLFVLFVLF